MPAEHEMPAPVTTTIFLHLATACDMLDKDLREVASAVLSSSSVTTMMKVGARHVEATYGEGRCTMCKLTVPVRGGGTMIRGAHCSVRGHKPAAVMTWLGLPVPGGILPDVRR